MNLAPIVLFVYNRPIHTQRTLNALALNPEAKESELYIYCDGAKENADKETIEKIDEVRKIINEETRFKEVIVKVSNKNLGLKKSILNGVTDIVNQYGKIIVLEDDMETNSMFLDYMNSALNIYEENQEVFHINGYNPDTNLKFLLKDYFFLRFMSCWGWATWKNRWNKLNQDYQYFNEKLKSSDQILHHFNYDGVLNFDKQLEDNIVGKINTWAILWFSTVYFNNGLCLTPKHSLTKNIGNDGSGVNSTKNSVFDTTNSNNKSLNKHELSKLVVSENHLSRLYIKLFYTYGREWSLRKTLGRLKRRIYNRFFSTKHESIEIDSEIKKMWYGDNYGGFYIHPNLLNSNSIVYSFGIGENISFDLKVISEHNCPVYAFDPTPKSIKWVESQEKNVDLRFYPFGIDTKDGTKNFFLPKNENYVSGSIYEANHVSESIIVNMKSLSTILNDFQHTEIDVLKMDIEGSEYEIIDYIIDNKIGVKQILVEFHDRFFENENNKSYQTLKKLRQMGYLVFGISDSQQEVSLIHSSYIK